VSQKRFGLLGIFSTDDAAADLRYLESEQYDDYVDEEPLDELDVSNQVQIACGCSKCDNFELRWTGRDKASLEQAEADWTRQHAELNPTCNGDLSIAEI